jgi:hypothetical protein
MLKAQAEQREKERLERTKQEFFVRILTEQTERAKAMRQRREEKEKLAQVKEEFLRAEREREKAEGKRMFAEDLRREENLEKQRKKILQFGAASGGPSGAGNEKSRRPNSATGASGLRRKLMSHVMNRGGGEGGEGEEENLHAEAEAEGRKAPVVRLVKKPVAPPPPVLSKEEEERLRLEREEKEREKLRQQELRELALKKRLAMKLAQEREEKERAALAEEAKKKEQELVSPLSPVPPRLTTSLFLLSCPLFLSCASLPPPRSCWQRLLCW